MPGEMANDALMVVRHQIHQDLMSEDMVVYGGRLRSLIRGLQKVKEDLISQEKAGEVRTVADPHDVTSRTVTRKLDNMLLRTLAFKAEELSAAQPNGYQIAIDASSTVDYLIDMLAHEQILDKGHHRYNLFKETPLDLVISILHLTGNDSFFA